MPRHRKLFYALELRRVFDQVLRREGGDLVVHGLNAIPWIGMIAEELNACVALRLELAKEFGHLFGIVSGVVHDVGAHQVRFVLRLPGIVQKIRPNAEANAHQRQLSQDSGTTDESAQDLQWQLRLHLLRCRSCAMMSVPIRSASFSDCRELCRKYDPTPKLMPISVN